MSSKFTELAIDSHDPARLADFWCRVLDYEEQGREGDDIIMIGPPTYPDGKLTPGPVPPCLTFVRVGDGTRGKNRLHFDINATDRDQEAEVERLIGLGATRADVGQGEAAWEVLADPERNEFCVLRTRCA